jgi:Putative metallopeptidase
MKHFIAALCALALTSPALSQEETVPPEGFSVNNAYSALYHEFGHLFVDQFQIPILGNEEYVADAIATLLILKDGGDIAYDISYDTVDGYLRSAEIYGVEKLEEVDFNDEHGMDQQRAAQMTCLLVGANPDQYGELATQMGMEAERQEGCAFEYEQAKTGWEKLIGAHLRGDGPEGAKLTVAYEEAGEYEPIARLLKDEKVLETIAAVVTKEFKLAKPATLKAALCGEENAFYDPEESSVTLCYEYAQLYYDMIADPENAGMDAGE